MFAIGVMGARGIRSSILPKSTGVAFKKHLLERSGHANRELRRFAVSGKRNRKISRKESLKPIRK